MSTVELSSEGVRINGTLIPRDMLLKDVVEHFGPDQVGSVTVSIITRHLIDKRDPECVREVHLMKTPTPRGPSDRQDGRDDGGR